jgi:hypothetical protein
MSGRKEVVEDPAEEVARLEKRLKSLTDRKDTFESKSMSDVFSLYILLTGSSIRTTGESQCQHHFVSCQEDFGRPDNRKGCRHQARERH